MREVSIGNAPPVSDTQAFLIWVQAALGELERATHLDRFDELFGNAAEEGLGLIADLEALTDPGGDRLLFWDDSEGALDWLQIGTGLGLATTTLSLSHLGLEALTDPGADRILFWDQSGTATAWLSLSGLTISGTVLAVNAASTSSAGIVEKATDGEVRAAATDKYLAADHIETASALVALTDATTVSVDWDAGINFELEITTNRTLGNPTNGQPGTWRTIYLFSDGGPDTLSFDSNYAGPAVDDPPVPEDGATEYIVSIYCAYTDWFIVTAIPISV